MFDARAGRLFITRGLQPQTSLLVLDAHTGAVLRTVLHLNVEMLGSVDGRTGHVIVVTDAESPAGFRTLVVLDGRTGAVIRTLDGGFDARPIAVDQQSGRIVVVNNQDIPRPGLPFGAPVLQRLLFGSNPSSPNAIAPGSVSMLGSVR